MSKKLPYESNSEAKLVEQIRANQRQPLPDSYSKELRDLVESMLNIDMNQRITIQQIIETELFREHKISSEERAYLEKLLSEKGKRLASNIYRGSFHGFMLDNFHSRCD